MIPARERKLAAFTLIELLVGIAVIVILAALYQPAVSRAKLRIQRIACVSNLKQGGVAYRTWATENGDFPAMIPVGRGGWKDLLNNFNQGINCWTNYAVMANEFGRNPKILVCPSDERQPATNFFAQGTAGDKRNAWFRNNTAISYFVGVGADDALPSSILGGDRNLGAGLIPGLNYGFSPPNNRGNDVPIQTSSGGSPVCWSLKMHSAGSSNGAANVLLGDGSVHQLTSAKFRTECQIRATGGQAAAAAPGNWPAGYKPPKPAARIIFP